MRHESFNPYNLAYNWRQTEIMTPTGNLFQIDDRFSSTIGQLKRRFLKMDQPEAELIIKCRIKLFLDMY